MPNLIVQRSCGHEDNVSMGSRRDKGAALARRLRQLHHTPCRRCRSNPTKKGRQEANLPTAPLRLLEFTIEGSNDKMTC